MARGTILVSVMIFTMINILAVFFASHLGVTSIGNLVVSAVFDEDTISGTNPQINPELDSGLQKNLQGEADAGLLSILVDGLKKVFGFIINLLTLGFAMMNMFIQTGTPVLITYTVGLTVAIGFYISIASAVRGFSI